MKKTILFVLFFGFVLAPVFAQNILIVKKKNGIKRFRYHAGDHIEIETRQGERLSGEILQISDSCLHFSDAIVPHGEIAAFYKPRKFWSLCAELSSKALLVYIPANVITNYIQEEKFFKEDTYQIGGVALAFWALSSSLRKKRIKTGKRWEIQPLVF